MKVYFFFVLGSLLFILEAVVPRIDAWKSYCKENILTEESFDVRGLISWNSYRQKSSDFRKPRHIEEKSTKTRASQITYPEWYSFFQYPLEVTTSLLISSAIVQWE